MRPGPALGAGEGHLVASKGRNELSLYHCRDDYYPHPRPAEAAIRIVGVELAVK